MRRKDAAVLGRIRRLTNAHLPVDTRFRLYLLLMEVPVLAEAYVRGRGRVRHKRLRRETRLVIDGFGSSANTFCREAFLAANPGLTDADVCSNLHSPRVVRRAVRRGVPCVVLIRDPRDAATSLVQRFPGIRLESALWYYSTYYSRLLRCRSDVVIAPFPLATSDFPAIIRKCNERFGARFHTGEDVPDLTEQAFARIDALARQRHGGFIKEMQVSRPSTARKPAADMLRHLTPTEQRALDRALFAWNSFRGGDGDVSEQA